MIASDVAVQNPFRPQRYPAVRAIVESDESQSLAQIVGEKILAQIVQGELPVGTRLKTTELAERLGVSRTPVAKALAHLVADGILAQRNHHQAVVIRGAADWLVQIHELRQLLEPEAAFRAAGSIEQEALHDLWALCNDAKPTRRHDWTEPAQYFDFALHLAVAEFCGNLPMKVSIRRCWSYKWLSYRLSEGCRTELKSEYAQHVAILSALAEGDGPKARSAMAKHLQSASLGRYADRVV